MTVRDRDHGSERFLRTLEDLGQLRTVTVGIHEDVGAQEHPGRSDATIAEVATYQEFGTIHDVPKAFVRGAVDGADVEQWMAQAGERALRSARFGTSDSGHAERAFARVGDRLARMMKRRVPVESGALRDAIEVRLDGRPAPEGGV